MRFLVWLYIPAADLPPLPQDNLLPVPPHFATKRTFQLPPPRIRSHPSHLYLVEVTFRVRF